MKSGKLNFLEPCGPLQACNWAALLVLLKIFNIFIQRITNNKIRQDG
jgi:hypothetical protein